MIGKHKWVCPQCDSAVIAGKAPRQNATARYCLACSAKSDTLVERTCPVLDRKREEKAARHRAKAERGREIERARREAERQRAEEDRQRRRAACMDSPKYGDTPEEMDAQMRWLDRKLPADVYFGEELGFFGLTLATTTWRGLAGRSSPHSRSSLAVLLDYAESIGHPDAARMRAQFMRFGGMPDASPESAGRE